MRPTESLLTFLALSFNRTSLFVIYAGHHLEMAEKYGALIFGVEHRFYGGSIPDGGLSTKNLQYLSSQQA